MSGPLWHDCRSYLDFHSFSYRYYRLMPKISPCSNLTGEELVKEATRLESCSLRLSSLVLLASSRAFCLSVSLLTVVLRLLWKDSKTFSMSWSKTGSNASLVGSMILVAGDTKNSEIRRANTNILWCVEGWLGWPWTWPTTLLSSMPAWAVCGWEGEHVTGLGQLHMGSMPAWAVCW